MEQKLARSYCLSRWVASVQVCVAHRPNWVSTVRNFLASWATPHPKFAPCLNFQTDRKFNHIRSSIALGRALTPRRNPHRARSQAVPVRSTAKIHRSQEGLVVRRVCRAHRYPPASLSHRFASSPVDALIDLKVGCRLRCQIPVCWLDLRPVIHLRITVLPQWRPARRGYVRRF